MEKGGAVVLNPQRAMKAVGGVGASVRKELAGGMSAWATCRVLASIGAPGLSYGARMTYGQLPTTASPIMAPFRPELVRPNLRDRLATALRGLLGG